MSATATAAPVSDRPLIPESSTAESTNVEVVMNKFEDGTLYVPEYQRDTDQWG